MAKKIVLEFQLNGVDQSIGNISELEDAIKKLESDLKEMDLGTEAFENQKNQIDELKDKYQELSKSGIQSAKEQADAQKKAAAEVTKYQKEKYAQVGDNLEKMAKGITDAVGGLFIAFGASEESADEFNKVLAEGIGIATGVKGAIEGVSAGMELWNSIGPQVIGMLQKIWATMMANPIIAIIAAIAALVIGLIAFANEAKEAEKSQKELNDEQEKAIEIMSKQIDFSEKIRAEGFYRVQETGELIKLNKVSLNQQERELSLMKAKGASNKEIFEAEQKIALARLENLKIAAESYQLDTSTPAGLSKALDLKKQINDAENQLEVNRIEFAQKEKERIKEQAEAYRKAQEDKWQKHEEELKRKQELEESERIAEQATLDSLRAFDEEKEAERKRQANIEIEIEKQKQAALIQAGLAGYEAEKKRHEDSIKLLQERSAAYTKFNQTAVQLENALNDLVQQLFQNRINSEKSSEKEKLKIQKRAFNVNKAFQLATAVQSGAQAVLSALANPPGPPITVPAAIAAGALSALQIAKIAATKFQGEGGGGEDSGNIASGIGGASTKPAQPQINLYGTGGGGTETVGPAPSAQGTSQPPVKAFVLLHEITNGQQLQNQIESYATL